MPSIWRGRLNRICGIDGQPGDRIALREETTGRGRSYSRRGVPGPQTARAGRGRDSGRPMRVRFTAIARVASRLWSSWQRATHRERGRVYQAAFDSRAKAPPSRRLSIGRRGPSGNTQRGQHAGMTLIPHQSKRAQFVS